MLKNHRLQQTIILFVILFSGIYPRLYHIDAYMYDAHSTKQTNTYAMAYRMSRGESNLLHPRFYEAPCPGDVNQYFFHEFPVYQWILSNFINFENGIVYSRTINIIFYIFSALFIYLIADRLFSRKIGVLAALAFNFFPSSVFWGRTIIADNLALCTLLGSFFVVIYIKVGIFRFLGTIFLYSLALLIKPNVLIFIPIMIYLNLKIKHKYKSRIKDNYYIFLSCLIPLTILLIWMDWTKQFPESCNFLDLNNLYQFNNYLGWPKYYLESNWFPRFLTEQLFGRMLTPLGGLAMFAGLLIVNIKKIKFSNFINLWIVGSFLTISVVAAGSDDHDYYLIHWLPIAAILCAFFLELIGYWLIKVAKSLMNNFTLKIFSERFILQCLNVFNIFLFLILLYFLGYIPYKQYINWYFNKTTSTLWSESHLRDYYRIKLILPSKAKLITIQHNYDSLALNYLKIEGYIIDYNTFNCVSGSDVIKKINTLKHIGAKYLLVNKYSDEWVECKLQNLIPTISDNYKVVYDGERVKVYEL